jgi:hypothetical protein
MLVSEGRERNYPEVLYSQAVRHGSQYIRPSSQMRISRTDWQRTQNFSHWQEFSGCSHCAHLNFAWLVLVLMVLIYPAWKVKGK